MSAMQLMQEWRTNIRRVQTAHYDAALHFERLNLILGISVIVLSTVVSTSIFSLLSKSPEVRTQIFTGLFSIAAGVLASLQTFMKFSERAERHKVAGAKYSSFKSELEVEMVRTTPSPAKTEDFLQAFQARLAAVHEQSPAIPVRILNGATLKLERGANIASESK